MGINEGDKIAIFGDYNLPGIRWIATIPPYCHIDSSGSSLSRSCTIFLDGMYSSGFEQINNGRNYAGNTLDLILVNQALDGLFILEDIVDPLVPADPAHPPFCLLIKDCFNSTVIMNPDDELDFASFDYKRANYDALNQRLAEIDWSTVCLSTNVDDSVENFSQILHHVFGDYIPLQRPSVKPPWSNSELRNLKRKRNAAHRTYRTLRSYKICSYRYKSLNNKLYRRYARKIERNLKRNPKQFWNFVNSKRKDTGLPSAMHLDHRAARTCAEKCSLFAEFFASVFDSPLATSESTAALSFVPSEVIDADTFTITAEDLLLALSKLKMSFRPGPDGVPASILKKCSANLIAPLQHILNLSLRQSCFPTLWKKIIHVSGAQKKMLKMT
ncbi:uncharacterized protein LOC134210258 [Armigeres subalbatus]|uniref:uncharacterized protein LOC134210258 n=1 Tax=Armigeres subalbatus TaxID=124917 RepID=UPI002ED3208C